VKQVYESGHLKIEEGEMSGWESGVLLMELCGSCQELWMVSGSSSRTSFKSGVLGLSLVSQVWVPSP
jgi:hypothetical protein